MGKSGKKESSSGLKLNIQIKDGVKKVDELEVPFFSTVADSLNFDPLGVQAKNWLPESKRARDTLKEIKEFLSKYA